MTNHPFSEVKGFHRKLRRMVDRLTPYFEEGTRKQYPEKSDAISRLGETVDAEMKTRRNRVSPTCPNPSKQRKLTTATGTRVSTTNGRSAERVRTTNSEPIVTNTRWENRAAGKNIPGVDRQNVPFVTGPERPRPDEVLQ